MSNTRHAADDSEVAQEKYLSSPEYVEMRGIAGNAVAAKAELMLSHRVRSLLFFLQGMSIRPGKGGVKNLVCEFLERFQERIGTPTMHKVGIIKGRMYGPEASRIIRGELGISFEDNGGNELLDEILGREYSRKPVRKPEKPSNLAVDEATRCCKEKLLRDLPNLSLQICIDPAMQVPAPGADDVAEVVNLMQVESIAKFVLGQLGPKTPAHVCFKNLPEALYRFLELTRAAAMSQVVKTSTAEKVFQNLGHSLTTGKIVVLEGAARLGKTTPAEAWCSAHLGEARFVSLTGITSKTTFFRLIARALGIASGLGRSSTDTQSRVEDMLHRSRIMLVIDEAHFLFSQGQRVYSHPELVNWIDTALFNYKVPTALISTPQFSERLHQVENQTGWQGAQFRGRISRYIRLPKKPSESDVEAVAKHLLAEANGKVLDALVGYAFPFDRPLPALVGLIEEARIVAAEANRDAIQLCDIERALIGRVLESDAAKATIEPPKPKTVAPRKPVATTLQTDSRIAARIDRATAPAQRISSIDLAEDSENERLRVPA